MIQNDSQNYWIYRDQQSKCKLIPSLYRNDIYLKIFCYFEKKNIGNQLISEMFIKNYINSAHKNINKDSDSVGRLVNIIKATLVEILLVQKFLFFGKFDRITNSNFKIISESIQ